MAHLLGLFFFFLVSFLSFLVYSFEINWAHDLVISLFFLKANFRLLFSSGHLLTFLFIVFTFNFSFILNFSIVWISIRTSPAVLLKLEGACKSPGSGALAWCTSWFSRPGGRPQTMRFYLAPGGPTPEEWESGGSGTVLPLTLGH